MVPRPRAPKGLDRPSGVRGGTVAPQIAPLPRGGTADDASGVALTRTPQGWAVVAASGAQPVDGLIEGLTLADLVVEELGGSPEPDRSARRSARGAAAGAQDADPRDARIAALERTVAQLEHALAARVATERAIGVLVERYDVSPRDAFDALRGEARARSRAVQELAREVLDGADELHHRLGPALVDADVADGRF